jgi:hypothetical protein
LRRFIEKENQEKPVCALLLHNFAYSRNNNWIPHGEAFSLREFRVCAHEDIARVLRRLPVHIHPGGSLFANQALKVGAIDCISFVAATAAINFECPVDVSGGGGGK